MKTLVSVVALLCVVGLTACGDSKRRDPQGDAFVNFVQRVAATAPDDAPPVDVSTTVASMPENNDPIVP